MMNRQSAAIAAACHLVLGATVSAGTFFVSPRGDDNNEGTSEARPLRVVQHAIDQMQAGDTLVVLDGV